MQYYYFDTDDGRSRFEDEEGLLFNGNEAAEQQARTALSEMARDVLAKDETPRTITVQVRNGSRKPFYKAALTLTVERDL